MTKTQSEAHGENTEITASELASIIQNRGPGTVTDSSVKLFCVLSSVRSHYKRRRKQNRRHRRHHHSII